MNGNNLYGKTVGIMGLGRIGAAAGERLRPVQLKEIIYHNRKENPALASELEARYVSFDELLSESDVLVVACPLTPATKGIFDRGTFQKMKKSAIIVNIARGGIINQDDLIAALKEGEIRGAGLDVMVPEPISPDHELLRMPNVTVTPHMASSGIETRTRMWDMAAENLLAALDGRPMPREATATN